MLLVIIVILMCSIAAVQLIIIHGIQMKRGVFFSINIFLSIFLISTIVRPVIYCKITVTTVNEIANYLI